MAQERGWVDPAALRSVYASLPPERSLAEALAQHGLLDAAQVQALYQELSPSPSSATLHLPPPTTPTVQLPGPGPGLPTAGPPAPAGTAHWSPDPTEGSQTLPLSPPGQSGTAHWSPQPGSGTLPPPAFGQDGTATLPPQGPAPRPSSSGSSMDAATLMGGAPPSLSSSGAGGLPQPGDVMAGRYGILRVLGQGGMGAVYLADDRQRGTQVALKVMLPGAAGEQALIRFQREAEALAKVDDHVGIVRIRDYGSQGGLPYAALDLIEGGDLHERVKAEGPLPIEEAVRLTAQVARAIQHCHERNILHRDLKPANVMVRTADGAPFVTDFGLAYDSEDSTERLTQTGQVMGTPAYMPPEQAEGDKEQMDARSDVYGLGAILYELLAGEAPFRGEGMAIIKKVLLDEPRDLHERRAEVSPDLARIQQKAMAKDPELRYASAEAFASDLERLQRGEPIEARPPTRAERQRWRRRQGDKRAIAAYVGLRILLPIGLVLGLALGVFQFRPWERFQVHQALSGHVSDVLAGPIAYPRSKGAGPLNHEATQLVSNLAKVRGVEPEHMERPNEALWSLLDREGLIEDPELRATLEAYALRADIAFGARPRSVASELDAKAATVDLLRRAGYGRGEPLGSLHTIPDAPPGAPKSAKDLLKTLRRIAAALRTYENDGWDDVFNSRAGAWSEEALKDDLNTFCKYIGGPESWSQFINARRQSLKRTTIEAHLREVVASAKRGVVDGHKVLNICERGLVHLRDPPAVETRAIDETLLELGVAALHALKTTGKDDMSRSDKVVELVCTPQLGDLIDWEAVIAKVRADGWNGSLENLIAFHLKQGSMPVELLVLCLRLGLHLNRIMEIDPNHYASELQRLITSCKRDGRAPGAAYLLRGDVLYFRARQTDVDRDNPEITVQIAASYASALGPDALGFDPTLFPDLTVDVPSKPPPPRWAAYARSRMFRLLADYEHYLNVNRPHHAKTFSTRHKTLILAGLAWYREQGALIPLGDQVNVLIALARRLREARDAFSEEEYRQVRADQIACIDQSIEAFLVFSESLGGTSARTEASVSQLDQGVGPDHLQRNLCGLLESYYLLLQNIDFPRCLARVREVHKTYQANMGQPSPYLFKAAIQLSLGMGQPKQALVEAKTLVDHYENSSPGAKSELEDFAERLDGARAWLCQAYAQSGDQERAQEVRKKAVAEGGGGHDYWTAVLPYLEAE